ncbi:MAG: prolipoprotein diacylglyceryl transferase [Phycisphaeraceae bacterium]|nr:prolipoprotein diacylglyceryl transferase [Phycisphaeraceae bacterium]
MLHTLAAYVHDIDPYAIMLWEDGPIRWYGLSYLLGFFLAYLQLKRVVKVGHTSLQPKEPADFVMVPAIGLVLGGRLGYVLFYKPAMLWTFTSSAPFWDVLAINKGGMASHGGIIGLILACCYYSYKRKHNFSHLLDLCAMTAPIGVFFGRLANFVNGELYGRPCHPDYFFAVKFPQEMETWDTALLTEVASQFPAPPQVMAQGLYYYVHWFVGQVQAHNAQALTIATNWVTPRHPSQIYQALLEGLALWLILVLIGYKPRKPLVIAGWFCTLYAIFRVIAEFFREPDLGIGLQLGLSRGQWLSFVLFAFGVGMVIFAVRRKAQPMGGWLK